MKAYVCVHNTLTQCQVESYLKQIKKVRIVNWKY